MCFCKMSYFNKDRANFPLQLWEKHFRKTILLFFNEIKNVLKIYFVIYIENFNVKTLMKKKKKYIITLNIMKIINKIYNFKDPNIC